MNVGEKGKRSCATAVALKFCPCELLDEYFEPVLHAENVLRSA